jgi:hypothetical protein
MKTIRLSESQLVNLINKVVTENQFIGAQGMSPMPEATATEEPKKESKPRKPRDVKYTQPTLPGMRNTRQFKGKSGKA